MKYLENSIFDKREANENIDRLFFYLNKFSKDNGVPFSWELDIALSGIASSIMQGGTIKPCPQIVFITKNEKVLEFIRKDIVKLLNIKGAIYFKDRIVLYFYDYIIEIFYYDSLVTTMISEIYLQLISTIPTELL